MAFSPIATLMQLLRTAPAISAIVADRVYAEQAPQAEVQPVGGVTLPHIVVRATGGSQGYTLDGPSGVREARIAVITLAPRFSDADAVAVAINAVTANAFQTRVDGRDVTMFAEAVVVSDFVDSLKLFRHATEIRLVITG